jgi:hypothetical protein
VRRAQQGSGHGALGRGSQQAPQDTLWRMSHDSGNATPSGFELTGLLNTLPMVPLNAFANLQIKHMTGKRGLVDYLFELGSLPNFTREVASHTSFTTRYKTAREERRAGSAAEAS